MQNDCIRALLIEDNPGDARLIVETLHDAAGFCLELNHIDRLSRAFAELEQSQVDVIVLDLSLPDSSGYETFQRVHERYPSIPTVLITGLDDEELGARAVRDGAQDYIIKNQLDGNTLARTIRYAVERKRSADALYKSEQLGKKIFSSLIDAVLIVETDTFEIIDCNPAASKVFGYSREEILGNHIALLFQPAAESAEANCLQTCFSQRNENLIHEKQLARKDNSCFIAEYSCVPLEDDPMKTGNWLILVRDITGRKEAQNAILESEERYTLAVRGANDGLWDWDLRKDQLYYSPRWKMMLGYEDLEINNTKNEWFDRIHPEDREKVTIALDLHLNGYSTHFEMECRMLHRDGVFRWMMVRGLAVLDESGVAYRMAGSLTDINARKSAEEQLIYDAFHDLLTELPNRALFLDRLGRTIEHSRRYDKYLFAVLFLDLDRFKVVNDSLGHSIGDLLLKEIGATLKSCLRAGDTVARLGGDEFVILLEDIQDLSHATRVTERILNLLSKPFILGDHQVFTSASIGVVLSTIGYTSTEEVLRDADIAMYQAKMMGKAKYVVFDKEMRSQVITKLKLENDLRVALERGEFEVYYQPIISIDKNTITGFEALIRWNHPEMGLITPNTFIPIAEETGMILDIGRWVLETSCRQVLAWQKEMNFTNLNLSVNISYRQFCHPNFMKVIKETLRLTQFDPYCLNLEITENILMDNSTDTRQLMIQLQEMGTRIHIDDFGTGYSSLSYLQRFPVNTLKIDRSFISQLGENGENSEIIRTILILAHELGVECIAEGIETKNQMEQIQKLKCNLAQGYFICKPLATSEIVKLLEKLAAEKSSIEVLFPMSSGRLKLVGNERYG